MGSRRLPSDRGGGERASQQSRVNPLSPEIDHKAEKVSFWLHGPPCGPSGQKATVFARKRPRGLFTRPLGQGTVLCSVPSLPQGERQRPGAPPPSGVARGPSPPAVPRSERKTPAPQTGPFCESPSHTQIRPPDHAAWTVPHAPAQTLSPGGRALGPTQAAAQEMPRQPLVRRRQVGEAGPTQDVGAGPRDNTGIRCCHFTRVPRLVCGIVQSHAGNWASNRGDFTAVNVLFVR